MNERLLRSYIKKILESSQEDRNSIATHSAKSVKWNYPTDPGSLIHGSVFFQHKDNPNIVFKGNYETIAAPFWKKSDPRWSPEYRYNLVDLKGNVKEENVTDEQEWLIARHSRMVGKILDLVETAMPEGKQCEKLKKLLQVPLYDFRNDMLRLQSGDADISIVE